MNQPMRWLSAIVAGMLLLTVPSTAPARDDAKNNNDQAAPKGDSDVPTYSLIDASSKGLVGVDARGTGDGRMAVSVKNRTSKPLRVILPPGIVAQSATGQMGGMMGGMGGGMGGMGGGMGGMGGGMGGMGGGMGGMGGGMGGMGGGGGGGGGTMPPMMGMMMLSRMIMYFCGDFDSWDMRSLMMGMGGGGMGMGGGMGGMGGMGGGMMGGGMRSVPASTLAYADLRPGQTRTLPTRLVSISPLDPQVGPMVPEQGERLRIMGDVSRVNADPRVQKALRRLAAEKVPSSVSQLVMWRLTSGMDWNEIARLAEWANPYELTLARDFVEHLDGLQEKDDETGSILFQVEGTDAAGEAMAAELTEALKGKTVLGLRAEIGIPARPKGPAVACKVRIQGNEALVQVASSDGPAQNWVASGKFSLKTRDAKGRIDGARLADGVAEGMISRLVRALITKGPREKGKLVYLIRIDNNSPLVLSGLAIQGAGSKADEPSKVLTSIGIPPGKYLTLPASEDVFKALGLKQGVRVTALDLSGL